MEAEEIREAEKIRVHVNNMITETFKLLHDIYTNNREGETDTVQVIGGRRLIFPKYRTDDKTQQADEIRISEQELRFAFIEVFNRYCDLEGLPWLYSVETPTMNTYFFSKGKKAETGIFPRQDKEGESANFDFVIHDQSLKRICLMEFKAHNAEKTDHQKDFLKLIKDHEAEKPNNERYYSYTQRYFVEILKSYKTCLNTSSKDTCQSLANKLLIEDNILPKDSFGIINYQDPVQNSNIPQIRFCCYSLTLNKGDEDGDITDKIINITPKTQS